MNTLMKRNSNGNLPTTSFSGMVDKFFNNDLTRIFEDDFWGFNGVNHSVNVPANVRETDSSYEVELVAPGLKKEDFKVALNGDTLTVSLERQEQNTEQDKENTWLRKEYRAQSFSRSFTFDDTVDVNKITAAYRDGILHLSLPKKEGSQKISRTINVG